MFRQKQTADFQIKQLKLVIMPSFVFALQIRFIFSVNINQNKIPKIPFSFNI